MRYFFFSSNPEPSLAGSVVVPAPGCREVSPCCAVQAVLARESGALTGAVVVSSITVTTDKDLAPAAGTEVVAGTEHRMQRPMRVGYIPVPCDALDRLCESTVWGMASVLDCQIEADAMPVSSALS